MAAPEQRPAPAAVELRRFEYTENATANQRRQQRNVQMREHPEAVYVTERQGRDDKLMFYTENKAAWKRAILDNLNVTKEEIISHQFTTPEFTIVVNCTGECVIHSTQENKAEVARRIDLIRLTMETPDIEEGMRRLTVDDNTTD